MLRGVSRRLLCSSAAASSHPSPIGVPIAKLSSSLSDGEQKPVVTIRGRLDRARIKGKLGFLQLRQPPTDTVQIVVDTDELLSRAKTFTPESIVEVTGTVKATSSPLKATTCKDVEIVATNLEAITLAKTPLPLDTTAKLDTRLDHRPVDLRTPLSGAVMRAVSAVGRFFREYLHNRDFVEIHTPKLLGTPSEGGSAIFSVDYFDRKAYLAQSPQLYKQMVLMGDGMKVFEIGPVFRAEKSQTHRHATEFVGLDAELVIHSSYFEVLDVLEGTLNSMITRLQSECADLGRTITAAGAGAGADHPIVASVTRATIEELGLGNDAANVASRDKYNGRIGGRGTECDGVPAVLRLDFQSAMQLLIDDGHIAEPLEDFSTSQEKHLGTLIKKRYGVDVYVVDCFPQSVRPFYTMPHPTKPGCSCSYDMYLRGEEICSGAQRIHDPQLLEQRAAACGVDTLLLKDYIQSFQYGAWPHGGFGLGLERIVMFFYGLQDIRQVALFPRDPKRISP